MSNTFSVLVSGRSWDWLRELCRPLGLQAQLVDATGAALLPPEGLAGRFSLRELLADSSRPLFTAVKAGLQSGHPQTLTFEGIDVMCAPLAHDARTRGLLVIARPARDDVPDPITGQQLNTVGGWLAGAVERHLSSTPTGPDNLTALHKVLQHVVQNGTDRDLVAVFAEALALWHDIEVVGYVETAAGVFVRAASLAGRTVQDRPIVFPTQSLPAALKMTRIPHSDIDGMETPGAGDVLVTTLSRGGTGCWLLVMSGAIDGCDPQVIGNYVSALDMAVALAAAASRTRVAMLMSHRLSAVADGRGFEAVLEALRVALAADSGLRRRRFAPRLHLRR